MVNVLRSGSAARMNYIKRFLAFVLVAALLMCFVIQPPRAQAVVLESSVVAAFLIVASSMGITFVAANADDLLAYISTFLSSFTASNGKTVAEMVISWVTGGTLQLAQDDATFLTEAVIEMEATAPVITTGTGYFAIDGFQIDTTSDSSDDASRLKFWTTTDTRALGTYTPFSWYPDLTYVLTVYENDSNYTKVQFYDKTIPTIWMVFSNSTVNPGVYYRIYLVSDALTVYCRTTSSSQYTITDSDFGQYLISLYTSNVNLSGTLDTALNTSVDSMSESQVLSIPTTDTADNTVAAAVAGTLADTATVTDGTTTETETTVGDLTLTQSGIDSLGALMITKFPFSIPWDFARAVGLLAAEPEAPHWEIDLYEPIAHRVGGSWAGDTTIEIDFADYEILGSLCRWVTTIIFCAGLAMGTKRLLWTA